MRESNRLFRMIGCIFVSLVAVFNLSASLAAPTELTVALYPFVPRVAQFEAAVQSEWRKVQPNVRLKFLNDTQWDGGYDINPPAEADVYVFDAIFFDYFRQQKWMEPLAANEIQNINDFIPYSIEGVRVGQKYYAIPQLGCANLLFYDKRDSGIANAKTLTQLKSTVNQCSYTSRIPPDRRGLMIDMSGGTTDAAFYLDATHSLTGEYPYPLPATPAEVNQSTIQNLRKTLSIGSYRNATMPPPGAYDFATWFSQGYGRAFVGFSEAMSQMTPQARQNIAFKVMPFSDSSQAQASFFADVIAVNTTVNQRGTRAMAVQLANVMASAATMVKSIGPTGNQPPQYLMSTRRSVFDTLGQNDPLYTKMYELTNSSDPIMFKLNEQSRDWLAAMKANLRTAILSNPVCGCDFPAVQQISNNNAAAAICNNTCSTHGGWNGQWTNDYPAATEGSVCGCNSCPAEPAGFTFGVQSSGKKD